MINQTARLLLDATSVVHPGATPRLEGAVCKLYVTDHCRIVDRARGYPSPRYNQVVSRPEAIPLGLVQQT